MKNELESFKEILQLKRYSKQSIDSYLSNLKLSQIFFENKSFVSINEKDWLNPPIHQHYQLIFYLSYQVKYSST